MSGPGATSPSAWQRLSGRPWRTGAWCWRPPPYATQGRPRLKTHLLFFRLVSGPEATSPSAWQRLSGRPWRTGAWCWRPPHSHPSRQTKLTRASTFSQCCGSRSVSFWASQSVSGSVIFCTDPDPSIIKPQKSKKNLDFFYFFMTFYLRRLM